MKGLFTVLALFFSLITRGQTVTAIYDSTSLPELYDRVPVGLKITSENGQSRQTEGFLRGNYRWNKIKVSSSNGTFQNGILLLDRKKLAEDKYRVTLSVTLPETSQPFETTLIIPHVEKIRFNHYADSLKRDIHYYLNVEGIFSSGKIFPLDTAAVKFEISTGKMIGQDLVLDLKDTTTKIITVNAVYKNDPGIKVSTNIPVKQLPDDESKILPNNYNKRH